MPISIVGSAQDLSGQWTTVKIEGHVTRVQPWTGIVLWSDHENANTESIQLEYSYVGYDEIVTDADQYDWSRVEHQLDSIASRGHQAVLRFYFVYPGRKTTVPQYIKALPDYREVAAESEGNPTGFVDWSHPAIGKFMLDFYSQFAKRYDDDSRLAYLQTGFGLWAEYHIYDGPWKLGQTFPSMEFQSTFLTHMNRTFQQTPWMISVDAADDEFAPFEQNPELQSLNFGLFDDSFLCKQHAKENAPNWKFFGSDRWKRSPAVGELSYYNKKDQKLALSAGGPNGRSFEEMAALFHISFMIGNDQPGFQSMHRIAESGMATGYRIAITDCQTNGNDWRITVSNRGVAPMYHDAYIAVAGKRSSESLKGLSPDDSRVFEVIGAGGRPKISIESDRLVKGQSIQFDTQ